MTKKIFLTTLLISGLFLAAKALADWPVPNANPPGCSPADSDLCAVPINTSSAPQSKIGSLDVGAFVVNGELAIPFMAGGVRTPGPGKVLTSDLNGLATWEAPSGVFWSQTGASPNFNLFPADLTSKVGIGTNTPNNLFQVLDLINFANLVHGTFLGYQAGGNVKTGLANTAVGYQALFANTTGSHNTALGANADVTEGDLTNATAIGYNAKVSASNALVLGGIGNDAVNVGIGTSNPSATLEVNGTLKMTPLSGPEDNAYLCIDKGGVIYRGTDRGC